MKINSSVVDPDPQGIETFKQDPDPELKFMDPDPNSELDMNPIKNHKKLAIG
jgi:hypothetical protein